MQFTIPFIAVIGLAAAQSSTTNDASGTTSSLSPTQTCLAACASGDVNCQAQCVGVPFPNGAQINATTDCSMNCDQGDGSPSATEQYGQCLQRCAASYYYSSSGTVPTAGFTGAAGAASTAGSASASATDSAMSASGSAMSGAAGASSSAIGAAGSASSSASDAASSATGAAGSAGSSASASASSSSSSAAAANVHVELGPIAGGILGLVMAVFAL